MVDKETYVAGYGPIYSDGPGIPEPFIEDLKRRGVRVRKTPNVPVTISGKVVRIADRYDIMVRKRPTS